MTWRGILKALHALLSGEIPSFTMEKRYVRKDGSIVWVNLNVAPLWRSGETPVHHISIVQDITERKRAEDALRRSERQLRTVLDALPVGVWFTDQSGKPVLSNPAAKEIWSGIKQIRLETAANTPGWWEAIGPSSEIHRWALSHALTKGAPSLNETLELECLDGTKKAIRNIDRSGPGRGRSCSGRYRAERRHHRAAAGAGSPQTDSILC